jgi:hypothetical protein
MGSGLLGGILRSLENNVFVQVSNLVRVSDFEIQISPVLGKIKLFC